MSFLMGRDGNISVVRAGALVAVLGLVVILGGLVIFSFEQSTYQGPLHIEPFPGAVPWGEPVPLSNTSRMVLYQVPGKTPEEVLAYYQQELNEYYGVTNATGINALKCARVPDEGVAEGFVEGSGNLPYFYKCGFDRSGFRMLQVTEVRIEPGVRNDAAGVNTEGMTIIRYDQQWEG